MNSGFYAAFTGYAARVDALDVLANNLANANTSGFKSQQTFYRTFADWLDANYESPINLAANKYGVLGGTRLDLAQGTLTVTGNDTDVALEGPGFIAVLTAAGIRYTRDGNLALDKDRKLVTQRGEAVLSEQPDGHPQPIIVPAGKVTITADGTVSVDGALVAKLRIENFPAETAMTQEGGSNLAAPAGAVAQAATGVTVLQGSLESSNADAVRTTVAIMDLERTAQAMEKALSIFHNEFNKTAAQDIGRI